MAKTNSTLNTGLAVREAARNESLTGPTCGLAPGYLQANLVIVPEAVAADFRLFCDNNPKPCPLLEVTKPGSFHTSVLAENSDLRTDVPRYQIYEHGNVIAEPTNISKWWRDDLVAFLLGCSFTFEEALVQAGIPLRHLDEGKNVPMFRTNIPCTSAGPFKGNLVVSMRPLSKSNANLAVEISKRFPQGHGGPVHLGATEAIGIADLNRPDFGDVVFIEQGEIPVFWACGVTTQVALEAAKLDFSITHSPGCMFVTDQKQHS